jgi:hypothetical protein
MTMRRRAFAMAEAAMLSRTASLAKRVLFARPRDQCVGVDRAKGAPNSAENA